MFFDEKDRRLVFHWKEIYRIGIYSNMIALEDFRS